MPENRWKSLLYKNGNKDDDSKHNVQESHSLQECVNNSNHNNNNNTIGNGKMMNDDDDADAKTGESEWY